LSGARPLPLGEEAGEHFAADEPDHALAVDPQLEQRPGLDDLAMAGEEVEAPELSHQALDAAAAAQDGAELPRQRLQAHARAEAPGGRGPLASEERLLTRQLAGVGRGPLLEDETGPE